MKPTISIVFFYRLADLAVQSFTLIPLKKSYLFINACPVAPLLDDLYIVRRIMCIITFGI